MVGMGTHILTFPLLCTSDSLRVLCPCLSGGFSCCPGPCFDDDADTEVLTALCLAEGNWDEVLAVVGKAHTVVHRRGVVRVQSSMRVGSRYVFFPSSFSFFAFRVYLTSLARRAVLLTTAGAGRIRSRRQRTR